MARGHLLSQVDPDTLRGQCAECGPVQVYRRTRGGYLCAPAQRERMAAYRAVGGDRASRIAERPHLAFRGNACERCGHVPLFDAALCVHHVDFDHANNDPANLKTLCLTCHAEVHALARAQEATAE